MSNSDKDREVTHQLKVAIKEGEFDLLLISVCNKKYAYTSLNKDLRKSASQSMFYQLLDNRRKILVLNTKLFMKAAHDYCIFVKTLRSLDNVQVDVAKFVVHAFNDSFVMPTLYESYDA